MDNTVYKFEVISEKETIDKNTRSPLKLFVVRFNGGNKTYIVKKFTFQDKYPNCKSIYCKVNIKEDGEIHLSQDRGSILDDLFEIELQYQFIVLSRKIDPNSDKKFYEVEDEYGLKHKLYENYNGIEKFEIGSEIQCTVKKINKEKGILTLIPYNKNSVSGEFISAEKLFEDIKMSQHLHEYFYALNIENGKKKEIINIFNDHENFQNLWIFSYLNYYRYLQVNDIEKLEIITTICIGIGEWIFNSGFLLTFSPEKQLSIRDKNEGELKKNAAQLDAIKIIMDNKQDEYILDIIQRLERGGYISDKEKKITTLKKILIINPETVNKQITEVAKLLELTIKYSLMDKYDVINFITILDRRILQEKNQLDNELHFAQDKSIVKDRVRNIILVLGTQILLHKINKFRDEYSDSKDEHSDLIVKLSMFYRYICYYREDPAIIRLALDALLLQPNIEPEITFDWEEIIKSDIEKIVRNLKFDLYTLPSQNEIHSIIFKSKKNSPSLERVGNQINIFSRRQNIIAKTNDDSATEIESIATFFDGKIAIASRIIPCQKIKGSDIEVLNMIWQNQSGTKDCIVENLEHQIEDFIIGDIVKVEFTNLNKVNDSHAFLKIIDEASDQIRSGMLHLNQVSNKIDSLKEIFLPKEQFYAKIITIDIEKNRIYFSIKDSVKDVELNINVGTIFNAKVTQISTHYVYWLSEFGFECSSNTNYNSMSFS